MNQPSLDDRVVRVRAYLTDRVFGYEHWEAKQFSAPDGARWAVLIICRDEIEQRRLARIAGGMNETGAKP